MAQDPLPSTQKRMLELLASSGRLEIRELARMLGVKPATVRKYALELEKMGLVRRVAGWVEITEEGSRSLGATREAQPGEPGQPPTPLYLVGPQGPILLRVNSLRQLAAAIVYGLASPEDIAFMLRSGLLQAWLSRSGAPAALVEELDRLSAEPPERLGGELTRLLSPYL